VAEAIYISFSKICGRGNLHFLFKDMWQRQSTFPFQRYAAEAIYISFSKTCGRGNLHFQCTGSDVKPCVCIKGYDGVVEKGTIVWANQTKGGERHCMRS